MESGEGGRLLRDLLAAEPPGAMGEEGVSAKAGGNVEFIRFGTRTKP